MTEQLPPDKSRRLGRGLSALIGSQASQAPTPTTPVTSNDTLREIRLDLIEPNPMQPRRDFQDTELQELQASIQANGLLQPVTVRHRTDGKFELIAGERRFRAARRLGWPTIPAYIRDASNEQMLSLALVENLQREDLNPIEEAEGYRQLINEFGLAHHQVAQAVGKDRSSITNSLRLLSLPGDVQHMVRDGSLTLGHARALLAMPATVSLHDLAQRVVSERLSVRDVERLSQEAKPGPRRQKEAASRGEAAPPESAEVRRLTDRLRRVLQTDVAVHVDSTGRGEVRIRFYSADDFNRVFELITGSSSDAD